MIDRPKVGIGCVVFKQGMLLLGKRKAGHMGGVYAGPGGHLENGESFEDCAVREIQEETGIEVENVRVVSITNLTNLNGKHYVDIGVAADWKSGTPIIMEPEKCEGWDWYPLDALPKPMIEDIELVYLDALKTGKIYYGTLTQLL